MTGACSSPAAKSACNGSAGSLNELLRDNGLSLSAVLMPGGLYEVVNLSESGKGFKAKPFCELAISRQHRWCRHW